MRPSLKTFLYRLSKPLMVRRVTGASMSPTLKEGQLVFATSLLKPKVNSVVIATHNKKDIVKRLVKKQNQSAYLRGDNSSVHHNVVISTSQIRSVVI